MTVTIESLEALQLDEIERTWDIDDCLLYAVGVGAGSVDPTTEIQFTTENSRGVSPAAVPTFGIILCGGGPEALAPAGVEPEQVLLVSEALTILSPIPAQGSVRVARALENVREHRLGLLVDVVNTATDRDSGKPVCETRSTTLICLPEVERPSISGNRDQHRRPFVADERHEVAIPLNQALIYRLTAGRNPLHSDPAVSRESGHDIPILHGRCTLGFVARELVRSRLDGGEDRLTFLDGKFIQPVFPGDTLELGIRAINVGGEYELSRATDGQIVMKGSYRCKA